MESSTHTNTFKSQLLSLLKRIESMLESCYSMGLTKIRPLGVELVIGEVAKDYSPEKLIKLFIKHHDKWGKVFQKDMDFVCVTLPEMLTSDKFDATVLAIPIKCHEDLKRGKINLAKESWPVSQKDEDAIWQYFKNLVTLSCRYINENKEKYPDVPLDTYVSDYQIKLVK